MRKILGVGVDESMKPLLAVLALWYVGRREREVTDE